MNKTNTKRVLVEFARDRNIDNDRGLKFMSLLILGFIGLFIYGTIGMTPTVNGDDLLWEFEWKYEYHILAKRCYKEQIERLNKNLLVETDYCTISKNLDKFRKAKKQVEVLPIKQQEQSSYVDKAIEILTTFEWFATKSYCDNLIYTDDGKYIKNCPTWKERYSIGYGTSSYPWEQITYNEWVARMRVQVLMMSKPLEDLSCFNDNQKGAILDFMYNSWAYTKHKVTGKSFMYYVKSCDKAQIKWFLNPKFYVSKGLKKRRSAEYKVFNW